MSAPHYVMEWNCNPVTLISQMTEPQLGTFYLK